MIDKYKPILEVLCLAVVAFLAHELIFQFSDYCAIASTFQYTLLDIYLYFIVCSIAIVMLLIIVKAKDINNVGNGFLLLTLIKIGITFLFAQPILKSPSKFIAIEKNNFFIIFAIFLAIETIVTIRILNKKQ